MSIISSFDPDSREIITPSHIIAPAEGFPETLFVTFTEKYADLVLNSFHPVQVGELSGGRRIPIWRLEYGGKQLGFYHTLLGGSASAGLLEEVIAMGGKKILFFGSCGSLDKEITGGGLVVPTAAYRDEGTSYHYAPPADFIEIRTAGKLEEIFEELHVPYIRTKTWTTDSFYRETRNNADARRRAGCSVVEMECASVMAVGQFRGVEVYQFLYAADCLDGADWDRRILGNMPEDMRTRILKIVLETAVRL